MLLCRPGPFHSLGKLKVERIWLTKLLGGSLESKPHYSTLFSIDSYTCCCGINLVHE